MKQQSPAMSTLPTGPTFGPGGSIADVTAGLVGRRIGGLRGAVWGVACAAALAGFLATSPGAAAAAVHSAGRELTMLLRFMAVLKAGFALGLVALAAWRLGFPARPGIPTAYLAACALMPAGAGLIWNLAHVVTGAVLFHSGMILMLGVGWMDHEDAGELMMSGLRRRARARTN